MLKRSYEADGNEHDEDGESENWLASYSDLVTDLMAVFVLLFSFALLAQGYRYQETAIGVLEGGAGVMETRQAVVTDPVEPMDAQGATEVDKRIDELVEELRGHIKSAGLEGRVSVDRRGKNRIVIRILDTVLFSPGKAVIKEKMKPTLDSIVGILASYDGIIKYIHIEGHTDDRPMNTIQFPSNWELSTGRAGSVIRYLLGKTTIAAEKFSSAGYGEFHSIADNSTAEGRALNRRVEFSIELLEESAAE